MDLYLAKLSSPIGELNVASTEEGVCMLEFDNEKRINKTLSEFKNQGYKSINKKNEHLNLLNVQLEEYFNSKRKSFDIPLHIFGTDFQKKVWNALLEIPFGTTRSYLEQSIIVGDVKAIRAIATANGANKISILIPCHRVIGSDGSLTGYGGELWRKRFLLELESAQKKLF